MGGDCEWCWNDARDPVHLDPAGDTFPIPQGLFYDDSTIIAGTVRPQSRYENPCLSV